ncbi:MAG: hypothetical protein BIFFINMI_03221 [Phycisphaerae bacterium]|nr:hypothetical protein [Phycisphaerae bacterium]
MQILMLIIGLVVGAGLGALAVLLRRRSGGERAAVAEAQVAERDGLLELQRKETQALRDQLEQAKIAAAQARTQLESAQQSIADQRKGLETAQQQLKDSFAALAGQALKSSNAEFLQLAKGALEKYIEQAKGDLGQRQEAIDKLVKPLGEALKAFDDQARRLESQRSKEQGELKPYLQSISRETRDLVEALRKPQVAGHWGELQLQRIVEAAGMNEHTHDFATQVTKSTDDGPLRPDMIVELPGRLRLIIDAKCPVDAFMAVQGAQTVDQRNAAMDGFTRRVRDRLRELSSKNYWAHFGPSPDFVVMFLPGESLFRAALDHDPDLMELGVSESVMLASPMTLLALMKVVAYSWRQHEAAENCEKIRQAGEELYSRVSKWLTHLEAVRSSLKSTVERFDRSVGSVNRMVLPSARRLKELGAGQGDDLSDLETIDQFPREVAGGSDDPPQPALPQ